MKKLKQFITSKTVTAPINYSEYSIKYDDNIAQNDALFHLKCKEILYESHMLLYSIRKRSESHLESLKKSIFNQTELPSYDEIYCQFANELETFLMKIFEFIDDNLKFLGDINHRELFDVIFFAISELMISSKNIFDTERYNTFCNSIKPDIQWILKNQESIEWK